MAGRNELFALEGTRIELATVVIGAAAAAAAGLAFGSRHGLSLALGAALSWLNYRWLKGGVSAVGSMATRQEGQEVPAPKGVFIRFVGRYVLLFAAAYVILTVLKLPAVALIAGLFSCAVAVLGAAIWHLARSIASS